MIVTPFAGVWIEIYVQLGRQNGKSLSLPSRECGLKYSLRSVHMQTANVTPFAGVWIEMCSGSGMRTVILVTPFAGVWIEIIPEAVTCSQDWRHSLRGSVD